ncbi:MAG: WD40/YVTN/BNR-like repeat-containing protein, partial [Candidatus Promineifilaceae bacterium]
GHLAIHPDNPDLVYVGAIGSSAGGGNALQKYDHKTKQLQLITIWPENNRGRGAGDWKYRFQWTYPIRISPHDSNVLYAAGNHLFRSTDEGQSWEIISPDLSRNDPETLVVSGGPLTKDTSGAENYATIFTFEESPHEAGLFWAGTDDGLVHISKDSGANWKDVTPTDLPFRTMIHTLEISPHDPATCYLACTGYKLDDFRPYLYKTNDYGETWEKIVSGIPDDDFTRVLREDPVQRGLLYVGTETGIYISFDDGANWRRMGGNFPVVPVYDMQRKRDDLVVATHGRSFWIMDDVTHLHQLARRDVVQLCAPTPHVRMPEPMFRGFLTMFLNPDEPARKLYTMFGSMATIEPKFLETGAVEWINHDCGSDAPDGVVLHYYLPDVPEGAISIAILDADGNEIRMFSSWKRDDKDRQVRIPAKMGLNRFEWNMRYDNASRLDGAPMSMPGPIAKPGMYQARLTVGENVQTVALEIQKDPRISASDDDLAAQFDLLMQVRDKLSEIAETVNKLRKVRSQIEVWKARADEASDLVKLGAQVIDGLTKVENTLVQAKGASFFDMNNAAKVAEQLFNLPSVIASADTHPTKQSIEAYAEYAAQADEAIAEFETIIAEGIPTLNAAIKSAEIPAIDC